MRILLIGANSYVASQFVEECLRREWEVFALTRDRVSQQILAVSDGHRVIAVPPDGARSIGSVDAIVNFAYPKGLSTTRIHGATLRLINGLVDAARDLSPRTVIHVSTQSVFGYAFSREPRPVAVRWAGGDSYIETKALAEWLFLLKGRGSSYAKVVLRLGNVIGPGGYWISEIARRVLFEEPLGRGASNATYVRNVADYICHVLSAEASALRTFGPFHHLAEFSSYTWDNIADRIGAAMGLRPVYRDAQIYSPRMGVRDLLKIALRYSAMLFPESVQDPIDRLQAWRHSRALPPAPAESDQPDDHPTLHQTVAFRSHTLPGWSPRFDMESALTDTIAWVRGAGYVALRRVPP